MAKHRPLSEVLADGFAKGDIRRREDLDMYLPSAVIRVNQNAHPGRVSPFHSERGQPPVHIRTLAMDMKHDEALLKELNEDEQKIAAQITYHIDALLQR